MNFSGNTIWWIFMDSYSSNGILKEFFTSTKIYHVLGLDMTLLQCNLKFSRQNVGVPT